MRPPNDTSHDEKALNSLPRVLPCLALFSFKVLLVGLIVVLSAAAAAAAAAAIAIAVAAAAARNDPLAPLAAAARGTALAADRLPSARGGLPTGER